MIFANILTAFFLLKGIVSRDWAELAMIPHNHIISVTIVDIITEQTYLKKMNILKTNFKAMKIGSLKKLNILMQFIRYNLNKQN